MLSELNNVRKFSDVVVIEMSMTEATVICSTPTFTTRSASRTVSSMFKVTCFVMISMVQRNARTSIPINVGLAKIASQPLSLTKFEGELKTLAFRTSTTIMCISGLNMNMISNVNVGISTIVLAR